MFKSRPAKLVLATQLALGLIATVQAEDAAAVNG